MPSYYTAKELAEGALQEIGAFAVGQDQADAEELRRAMQRLELLLNYQVGASTFLKNWQTFDIPLIPGVRDYILSDYSTPDDVQRICQLTLINRAGQQVSDVGLVNEKQFSKLPAQSGSPRQAFVDRTTRPTLRTFPVIQAGLLTGDYAIRCVVQTFAPKIDPKGTGNTETRLGPEWYLWAIKLLAYELGQGLITRLPSDELGARRRDLEMMEMKLLSNAGGHNTSNPVVTEPYGVDI